MSNTESQNIKYPELKSMTAKFIKYFIGQWKMVFLLCIITGALSFAFGKMQSSKFNAVTTFIVEDKAGSKGGGLSGIASQFGIDIGGLSGGGAGLFDGDNILEIMKSRIVLEKVLLTKVEADIPQKGKTLIEYYLDFSKEGKKLNDKGINTKQLNYSKLTDENVPHTILQDSVMLLVCNAINRDLSVEKRNKKSSIITLEVSSGSQVFSKEFSEHLLSQTAVLYIEIKTGNLTKSINKIQRQADSISNALNARSDIRNFINLSVPNEGVSRDKAISGALYSEVVKNLESMKLSLVNQTPVIQVLDAAKYPLIDQRIRALYYLIIGFALGFIGCVLYSFFKYTDN
jgi:uncharacterized protein involved in exopolysaccharide biosynthesis